MTHTFADALGVPLPACCSTGDCCKGASPSTPFYKLLAKAAQGDDFARGFFSIMLPYANHEAARAVVPGLVEKTLAAAQKSDEFPNNEADVVFYHCRYLLANNRCGVHEDRPQFCRDYPDSPFVVMAPDCAFNDWAQTCKQRYQNLKTELNTLKTELAEIQHQKTGSLQSALCIDDTKIDDPVPSAHNEPQHVHHLVGLSLLLSLTPLYLASPLQSFWFFNPTLKDS